MKKLINKLKPFKCPSCKKKRLLPAKIRRYFVERINQYITSETKHCLNCRKTMIKMLKEI